jgi:hypothetical protein
MASIAGWIYIAVGIVICAFSKFVESRSKSGSLLLFIIAGAIFIVIGVTKIMVTSFKKKMAESKDDNIPKQANHTALAQQTTRNQQTSTYNQQQTQGQRQHHHSAAQSNHSQGLHPTQHQQHRISQVQNTQPPEHQSVIVACPRCGARHYAFANFCMNCGSQLSKTR